MGNFGPHFILEINRGEHKPSANFASKASLVINIFIPQETGNSNQEPYPFLLKLLLYLLDCFAQF